jgi:stearoyl-CoA desaturase (delta-9 desaturase)
MDFTFLLSVLDHGVLNLSFWGLVLYTLIVTQTTIMSVTVYLHRTMAHGALLLHPAVAHFFRYWLWKTTGMITLEWVPIHRKHHKTVDTAEDPHSPIHKGKWQIVLMGVKYYIAEAKNPLGLRKYSQGLPRDWIEMNLYTPHKFLGVGVILGMINVILLGWAGLIVWGIQAAWIPFWAAGVINGAGHFLGYRNYARDDKRYPNVANSTNILPWGIWIGGEELHNNHHADPATPFFAHKWWEIDVGSIVVRMLCLFRLAKLRKPLVSKNVFQSFYYKVFNLGM